jgi:hypothetical protein
MDKKSSVSLPERIINYNTSLHIIKIGGNVIDNTDDLSSFLKNFSAWRRQSGNATFGNVGH